MPCSGQKVFAQIIQSIFPHHGDSYRGWFKLNLNIRQCKNSGRPYRGTEANAWSNKKLFILSLYLQNLATIAYERQHYEAEEKLVSFTYRPHLHAEGMFLLNIPGLTDLSLESYRVVHDFKTGKI